MGAVVAYWEQWWLIGSSGGSWEQWWLMGAVVAHQEQREQWWLMGAVVVHW
jgi:hypothetical protein